MLLITASYGQSKGTEKADKLVESYQYVAAIDEYLKLAQTKEADTYVYTKLADSYYTIFNTEEASKWYAKAVEGKVSAETHFRYAQSLKTAGKYQEANQQMDVFASMEPNDSRAKEYRANPNYIPSLTNKSKLFDIAETTIKSKGQSDFGAVLTNDNVLYFVSTRNASGRKDKWANQPYLDIFESIRNTDGTLSEPKAINELNTPFHDGPVALSQDGNTMFFARDSHSAGQYEKDKKANVKVGQQGLYKATKVDGKWTQITALPFNSTSYSVSHPSLSKDGKTLFFASNMPGGLGESDIWKVEFEDNIYGTPENVGTKINSPGKENFPFITDDNVLYFASSGKQGLGGLDVFKIDLNTSEEAQNVGKPVNSEKDDFSFSLNTVLNTGYFSSNRNGLDAIYSAVPVAKEVIVPVPVVPAEVIITDSEVLLNPIYFEFNKSNITAQGAGELDKLVKVMNDHPTMVILVKSHTDTKGSASYNLNLSEHRAQSTVQYLISKGISSGRISGKGFGSSTPKIHCGSNCTDEDHAQNRRSEFMIISK